MLDIDTLDSDKKNKTSKPLVKSNFRPLAQDKKKMYYLYLHC